MTGQSAPCNEQNDPHVIYALGMNMLQPVLRSLYWSYSSEISMCALISMQVHLLFLSMAVSTLYILYIWLLRKVCSDHEVDKEVDKPTREVYLSLHDDDYAENGNSNKCKQISSVTSNENVDLDVKEEGYTKQDLKEDSLGQSYEDLFLSTNAEDLKTPKHNSNAPRGCDDRIILGLAWLSLRLLNASIVQLLCIAVLPISCKVCVYLMSIKSRVVGVEKYKQVTENVSGGDSSAVLRVTSENSITLKMTSRQHNIFFKNRPETSVDVLRKHLKGLMKEFTLTNPFTSPRLKQNLVSSLLPGTKHHIERSKVQIYPLTSTLQYCPNEMQAASECSQDQQMCYELHRLMSFCSSSVPASSIRLAQSGFYAEVPGQHTRCFSCKIPYSDWRIMDRPDIVHRRISPGCQHLSGNDDRNIPIYPELSSDTHSMIYGVLQDYQPYIGAPEGIVTSSLSRLAISEEHAITTTSNLDISAAVYPQYRNVQGRLDSYQGWGWSHVQDPRVLAGAGFYYAGYRDCVRCFYCGVGLRTWEKEDDPWVEHVRWRSSCDYVRCTRGEQFVIEALVGNKLSSSSAAALPLRQINDNTAESQLAIQATETAIEPTTVLSTSTAQVRESSPPQTSVAFTGRRLNESALDANPACSLTGITSAREVKGTTPVETIYFRTSESTENKLVDEEITSHGSSNIRDPQIQQRQLEEENQSLRDETTCKVCLDNPSCIVFLPCGHLVTCAECAPALRKCPICRALIRGTVRAYSA